MTLEAQYGPPRQKDHLSARFCPRRGGVPDLDWICFVCFLDPAFPRYDRMVLVGTYGAVPVLWQRNVGSGGRQGEERICCSYLARRKLLLLIGWAPFFLSANFKAEDTRCGCDSNI